MEGATRSAGLKLALVVAAAVLALPTHARAGSLPEVSSGERPGPPLLYEDAADVPLLDVTSPFRAGPLLVSGTDAYRDGEYLYQDYLFDDRGANTLPGRGSRVGANDDSQNFSPTAGDVFYPTDDRYGNNAADLVEFRVRPDGDALVYRITLNTVKDDEATVVGIGIDRDGDGGGQAQTLDDEDGGDAPEGPDESEEPDESETPGEQDDGGQDGSPSEGDDGDSSDEDGAEEESGDPDGGDQGDSGGGNAGGGSESSGEQAASSGTPPGLTGIEPVAGAQADEESDEGEGPGGGEAPADDEQDGVPDGDVGEPGAGEGESDAPGGEQDDGTEQGDGGDLSTQAIDEQVDWPDNAGMSSPGLDIFITAWGTGAKVTDLSPDAGSDAVTLLDEDDVDIDLERNQMTIRVPYDIGGNPGDSTWRYVAGTGVYDGEEGFEQIEPSPQPTSGEPTSGSAQPAGSNVFNLAFRFDEPQQDTPLGPISPPTFGGDFEPPGDLDADPYDTFPGIGNWFEDEQARKLQDGSTEGLDADEDIDDAMAEVDFDALDEDRQLHLSSGCEDAEADGDGCEQARIAPSGLDLFEGVRPSEFPQYGGELQPYLITIPPGYDNEPTGLTFSLHSLGGGYTQYKVFSPNQLRQFGDERDNLVVTTLGHGPAGWYLDEAESDFFEIWADAARNFELDSERVAISGYSMGGYGTYKLAADYPDLFGKAFTTVGPPARGTWEPQPQAGPYPPPNSDAGGPSQDTNSNPLLENLRWVPFLNWASEEDQLVPYVGPTRQQDRFDSEQLRSELWTFQGDHFTLAVLDAWDGARDFLEEDGLDADGSEVVRDPSRVNYAFLPAADRPELELRHDHAYWASELRARDENPGGGEQFVVGCPGIPDQGVCPARGEIDARSLAFGEGDPMTQLVTDLLYPGPPSPAPIRGTEWTELPSAEPENALEVSLDNVGEAVIDGPRARLDGSSRLRVRIASDGDGRMRLNLPLPEGAEARLVDESDAEPDDGGPLALGARSRAAGAGTSADAGTSARAAQFQARGEDAPRVDLDRDGATFIVEAGTREYVISGGGGGGGNGDSGGGDSDDDDDDDGPGDGSGQGSLSGQGSARCLPRGLTAGRGGIGPLLLERTRTQTLTGAVAPIRRTPLAFRYCVEGGGRVYVAFSGPAPLGKSGIVISVSPEHKLRGIGRGSSRAALGRAFPDAERLGARRLTAKLRGGGRVVFGLSRSGRVRYVAIVGAGMDENARLLRSYLRAVRL